MLAGSVEVIIPTLFSVGSLSKTWAVGVRQREVHQEFGDYVRRRSGLIRLGFVYGGLCVSGSEYFSRVYLAVYDSDL
jgi:hypothetical protein